MARRRLDPCWIGVALLLWLAASAPAEETPAIDGISAAALEAHLAFLADDLLEGRESGTAAYETAARYVVAQFRQLGLSPAGEDGGYLQPVPFLKGALAVDSATIEIEHDGESRSLVWSDEFLMRGDAVRAKTEVTAPVAFVGFGVTAPGLGYDDYEGMDVEGKIVLALSGAPAQFPHDERAHYSSGRTKTAEAVARGAVGFLVLQSAADAERVPWQRITMNAGRPGLRWLNEAGEAQDYQPQIRGGAFLSHAGAEKLLEGAASSLEEILAAATAGHPEGFDLPVRVTLRRSTSHEKITSSNVAALLPGSDPALKDEVVVLTAHLDHVGRGTAVEGDEIYNGAYDNAMGVSVLLEVARALAAGPQAPRRSVLFLAVTGEEKGLLGSDYFANQPTVPAASLVANVNLDMPLFLFPLADLIAFGADHSTLAGPVARAAGAVGLSLSPDPMPEEVVFVRSDQYSFVRQGVPAVFLVAGFSSSDPEVNGAATAQGFLRQHYHMPTDDLTQPVDWQSARRFTAANLLLVRDIADADERPEWNEGDFFGEKFGKR